MPLPIKNTIIANNTADGIGDDFRLAGGTLHDNGYNIVEDSSGYAFSATGDITGEQATLNLSSTLEANNTTNGTYTLKTTSGSVAIDAADPPTVPTMVLLYLPKTSAALTEIVQLTSAPMSITTMTLLCQLNCRPSPQQLVAMDMLYSTGLPKRKSTTLALPSTVAKQKMATTPR